MTPIQPPPLKSFDSFSAWLKWSPKSLYLIWITSNKIIKAKKINKVGTIYFLLFFLMLGNKKQNEKYNSIKGSTLPIKPNTPFRKLFTYLPIIPVFGISMNNIKNKLSKKIDIPR